MSVIFIYSALLAPAFLVLHPVEAKCSYSFIVNEVDPTSCPCLLQQPSKHDHAQQVDLTAFTSRVNQDNSEDPIIKGDEDDLNSVLFNEGSASERQLNDEDMIKISSQAGKTNKLGSALLQEQLERLQNTMKNLELKVYQESVENRELKNLVIQQEHSVKDYKFLVERLKLSLTKQKVTVTKEKDMLQDEITTLKDSVQVMKETLNKQDYYLKNLEKNTQDLRMKLNPSLNMGTRSKTTEKMLDGTMTKVIPVQTTSEVLCDGLSKNATKYKDCDELYQRGHKLSGVYYVKPTSTSCPIPVYCKMNGTAGWLVFQRRIDGALNFNRKWDEYKDGFGDLNHEFWLGNNNIFLFTNQASYRLRIDMWDFNDTHRYAEYLYFTVAGERDKYRLFITNYTGNANDALRPQNGMMFSTFDEDNDAWEDYHCAKEWEGGWWYNNCWFAILNGKYHDSPKIKFRGISWNDWKKEQLKRTEMSISPSDYL